MGKHEAVGICPELERIARLRARADVIVFVPFAYTRRMFQNSGNPRKIPTRSARYALGL